jgi:hypothetical protein
LDDYKLKVQKYDNQSRLSVFVSAKYTTSYSIIPSATSFNESENITFDIIALNVVNGTVLYHEVLGVSGNVTQADFLTNITGTSSVLNNGIKVTLTANTDNNTGFEGNETFKLVIRKGSAAGSILTSSDVITLKDVSNTISYNSIVYDSDTIAEGSSVTFVLDTTNLGPNEVLYYSTLGNVTSADFVTGNTGLMLMNNNSNTLTLVATTPNKPGSSNLTIRVKTDSLSSEVLVSNTFLYLNSNLLSIN